LPLAVVGAGQAEPGIELVDKLEGEHLVLLLLALAVVLFFARLFGEIAKRFGQPAVLGEIAAGIVIGATVLGAIFPDLFKALFPKVGAVPIGDTAQATAANLEKFAADNAQALAFNEIRHLSIFLFMLIAGMEINLSTVWENRRNASAVSVLGIVVPFAVGFAAAYTFHSIFDPGPQGDSKGIFALFFATAMAISALPVIVKTLLDLGLIRTRVGTTVVSAAIFDDILGWSLLAVVLSLLPGAEGNPARTIGLVLLFGVLMLSLGRRMLNKALAWVQARTDGPGAVFGLIVSLALVSAAITQWIGIEFIFGSFIVGVMISDSPQLRHQTREAMEQFVGFLFAPLFFGSVALQIDFVSAFDLRLVVIVLVVACIGKIFGCMLAARWIGLPRDDAWAIGFGMNARGAIEIILATIGREAGLIGDSMFVAIVIMALVTSMMTGPAMRRFLRQRRTARFTDFLAARAFVNPLSSIDRSLALRELWQATVAGRKGVDAAAVADADVHLAGEGVAVAEVAVPGLSEPIVGVGLSRPGIFFEGPSAGAARVVVLVAAPIDHDERTAEVLSDIDRTFADPHARDQILVTESHTEFVAFVRGET
jgi:Kef-type K+ transport system membrane component KefB